MKRLLAILIAVAIFSGCALEAGRVIEIILSPSAASSAIGDALRVVAHEMGMVVEGPETGPGGLMEYRAKYPLKSSTLDFFISVQVGDRSSIVIRTLNVQVVDPSVAERAFELFRTELDRRGLKYKVRRS